MSGPAGGPPTLRGPGPVVRLDLGRAVLMGVVNVTPDSFSDGGRHLDPEAAIAHGVALAGEGATILDVGGESTRPGAAPVAPEEQIRRVIPVITGLLAALGGKPVALSVDTTSASVAAEAIAAGAHIVNDISAFTFDPGMLRLLAETDVAAVAMHTTARPSEMQRSAIGAEAPGVVLPFLARQLDRCAEAGVDPARIILDPGIGFGKDRAGNLALLAAIPDLVAVGRPVLIGVSRKRFIGDITGRDVSNREFGTAAAVALSRARGAHILRVHDVRAMADVLAVVDALAQG